MNDIHTFGRRALILCVWPFIMHAASAPLAGIHCIADHSTVYMANKLAKSYARLGSLSEQKKRSHSHQYMSAFNAKDFLESFKDKLFSKDPENAATIRLRDGSHFVLPRRIIRRLGGVADATKRIDTDARSMRPYAQMLLDVCQDLCMTTDNQAAAQVLRMYIEKQKLSERSVRSMRRVGWVLDVADWVDNVCAEYDGSGSSDSDAGSVSTLATTTHSTASALSFVSETDEFGIRRKRHDLARLVFEEGPKGVRNRLSEGTLNLKDCGLTSMHDLGVLHGVLQYTDRFAVKTIDLSDNDIKSVDDYDFAHFPHLETIILKNNVHLTAVAEHAFAGLSRLRVIDMSSCGLSSLPRNVFAETAKLEVLLLEFNKLERLPMIKELSLLSMLSIHHNKIADLPDISGLERLEVLNAAHNKVTGVYGANLPDPERGSLRCYLINDNKIERLSSGFMVRLPKVGIVNTCNNPMWNSEHEAETNEELCKVGYEKIEKDEREQGGTIADQVRDALFTDTCDKLFDYLIEHELIKAKVLKSEITEKRELAHIHTKSADTGMWLYRNGAWVVLGVTLVGGGIGAVVGYVIKKSVMKTAKRVAIGAGVGAAAGAAAGYVGYSIWNDSRDFYLSNGEEDVFMTSDLCEQYVGTFRLIALLTVLKQYLIACNTCLYWSAHYDELLGEEEHLNTIMDRLEDQLHLKTRVILARTSDAACIAMLTNLVADNPLNEVMYHCPEDLFEGDELSEVMLCEGAILPFLGYEKLSTVRSAICRFAQVARTVRAMLMNRYLGTIDHCRMLKLVSETEELKTGLKMVVDEVLKPTLSGMSRVDQEEEEWYEELDHLEKVANDTSDLLSGLEEQVSVLADFSRSRGMRSV